MSFHDGQLAQGLQVPLDCKVPIELLMPVWTPELTAEIQSVALLAYDHGGSDLTDLIQYSVREREEYE